ncbi:MAG: hypothetical protein WC346_18230 [Methanogenium sp.]|jgi:hypothetical protein
MFIKSVSLTKKHWSYKVLYWVFPSLPKFYNFCPYFWLTNLALIITPFKALFLGIAWAINSLLVHPISNLVDTLEERNEKKRDAKAKEVWDSLTKEELNILVYWNYNVRNTDYEKTLKKKLAACVFDEYRKKLNIIRKSDKLRGELARNYYTNYDFDKDFYKFRKENERKNPYQEKKEETPYVPVTKRPWYPKAIKYTKWGATSLVIPGGYLLYKFLYWLFFAIGWVWYWVVYVFNNIDWVEVGAITIITIIIIASVVGIIVFIVKVVIPNITFSIPLWLCKLSANIWGGVSKFFIIVGKFIGGVFSFFWTAAMSWKADNCPEIIWKDENE